MSGTADSAALYSAIEESAGLLDVPCLPDKVRPILAAYRDSIPQAMIAFRVATNARHEGEFDCRISIPRETDPYALALSQGLVAESGHPVDLLLPEIRERCPIDSYGIDFGVTGGFRKIWAFFPEDDLQSVSTLADLPSMPRGLAGNLDFFARHGLNGKVGLVGIDYDRKTVNAYFCDLPGGCRTPQTVLSMHREIGLPDPSKQMLDFCEQAFGIYTTLSWDSLTVKRMSFSVMTLDPLSLPVRLGPKIECFVRGVRHGVNDPKMVHTAVTSSGEEYYKLQTYYRWRPHEVNLAPSAESVTGPV